MREGWCSLIVGFAGLGLGVLLVEDDAAVPTMVNIGLAPCTVGLLVVLSIGEMGVVGRIVKTEIVPGMVEIGVAPFTVG